MKKNILLSIIIPCYNSGAFLKNTLSMIVKQGLNDIEILIVNDGSTDNTKEIANTFAEKYLQFTVLTLDKNQGQSIARNAGMRMAKGKYIYFLDSDDTLTDGSLDFFRETLSNNFQADGFVFGYEAIIDGTKIKKYVDENPKNNILHHEFLDKYLSKKLQCHICSVIFAVL